MLVRLVNGAASAVAVLPAGEVQCSPAHPLLLGARSDADLLPLLLSACGPCVRPH